MKPSQWTLLLLAAGLSACASGSRGVGQPSALVERGQRLLIEGRPTEAQAVFEQALASEGDPFLASIGCARAALALGDDKKFDEAMARAMHVAPRTPEALELWARTTLLGAKSAQGEKRRQRAMIAAMDFAILKNHAKDDRSLDYHLGIAHHLSGRDELAVPAFEAVLKSDPEHQEALEALIAVLRAHSEAARVKQVLNPYHAKGQLPAALTRDWDWSNSELNRRQNRNVREESP